MSQSAFGAALQLEKAGADGEVVLGGFERCVRLLGLVALGGFGAAQLHGATFMKRSAERLFPPWPCGARSAEKRGARLSLDAEAE